MTNKSKHAFCDDALGTDDALGLSLRLRSGQVSSQELVDAAVNRMALMTDTQAVTLSTRSAVKKQGVYESPFVGIPFLLKDNVDLRGYPTQFGTDAYIGGPAKQNDAVANLFLAMGFSVIGKTQLSEFGFNASCEADVARAVRNPWNHLHTAGGSSGGSAAAVAAGIVPMAHGNDGGGSLRIPAACCGLVGLKATRGRLVNNAKAKKMPVNLISEGVLTRSVRDTVYFFSQSESQFGSVDDQLKRLSNLSQHRKKRKIALVHSEFGFNVDPEITSTLEQTAHLLKTLGHQIEPVEHLPFDPSLIQDFTRYWGLLSCMAQATCLLKLRSGFHRDQLQMLTKGLSGHYLKSAIHTPSLIARLKKAKVQFDLFMQQYDAVLMPTVTQTAPLIGHLDPNRSFERLLQDLIEFTPFTPMANITGAPAISLPMGMSVMGLPIGVQLMGGYGEEATLLDLALELEHTQPFKRIWDAESQSTVQGTAESEKEVAILIAS